MNSKEYALDMSSVLTRLKMGMTIENARTARTKVAIAESATCPLRMLPLQLKNHSPEFLEQKSGLHWRYCRLKIRLGCPGLPLSAHYRGEHAVELKVAPSCSAVYGAYKTQGINSLGYSFRRGL
jgi:hypothetical protein